MSSIIIDRMENSCNKRKFSMSNLDEDCREHHKNKNHRQNDPIIDIQNNLKDFELKYKELLMEIDNLKDRNNFLQKEINILKDQLNNSHRENFDSYESQVLSKSDFASLYIN